MENPHSFLSHEKMSRTEVERIIAVIEDTTEKLHFLDRFGNL